jgi:glucosamine-6-phosphate deaminase
MSPNRAENIPILVFPDRAAASKAVAADIGTLIRAKQGASKIAVLGLTTGTTPQGLYAELVRMHQEEELSFANVVTFNVDEYLPMQPNNPCSYRAFMQMHLFNHVDIQSANTHLPDSAVRISSVESCCREYEEEIQAAGGIDLQILGIGRTGHIGFNEPGSPRSSRTRKMTLDPLTREDLAKEFGGDEHVPKYAITMGVSTILDARRIILMAWGQRKAAIVRAAAEGPMTPQVTASFLQEHRQTQFVIDREAATKLTRLKSK